MHARLYKKAGPVQETASDVHKFTGSGEGEGDILRAIMSALIFVPRVV